MGADETDAGGAAVPALARGAIASATASARRPSTTIPAMTATPSMQAHPSDGTSRGRDPISSLLALMPRGSR
jgi:hypothetical protein